MTDRPTAFTFPFVGHPTPAPGDRLAVDLEGLASPWPFARPVMVVRRAFHSPTGVPMVEVEVRDADDDDTPASDPPAG